ncbi:MAG: YcaO-like family protein [Bacillota bacterium]
MLKDSFKKQTLNGLYRTIHPIDTYKKAKKVLKKVYPKHEVRYNVDDDKYDYGISALYPRAVFLKNKNQNVYRACTWGKGVFPIASAVSCMMEMLEDISMRKYILKNFGLKKFIQYEMINSNKDFDKLLKTFNKYKLDKQYTYINRLNVENNTFEKVKISHAALFMALNGRYNMVDDGLKAAIYGCSSWGSGAGNNLEEALIHSLMEIIERISRYVVGDKQTTVPEIKIETIDNTLILQLIENLYATGIKNFQFSDWSVGTDFPSVAITYKADNRHYFKIGTGTTKEEAFQRAITEFIQTLGPQRMANENKKSIHLISELESENINIKGSIDYHDIKDIDDVNIEVEIETIVKRLEEMGLYTYFLDTYTEEIDISAVHTFLFNQKFDKIDLETKIFI